MVAIVVAQVRADRVNSLVRIRNFYGTLHVTQAEEGDLQAISRTLYNGVISHGQEVFRTDLRADADDVLRPSVGRRTGDRSVLRRPAAPRRHHRTRRRHNRGVWPRRRRVSIL